MEGMCIKKPVFYKYWKNNTHRAVEVKNKGIETDVCEPNDYIFYGDQGEQWVVPKKVFKESYHYDRMHKITTIKFEPRHYWEAEQDGDHLLVKGRRSDLVTSSHMKGDVIVTKHYYEGKKEIVESFSCNKDSFKKIYLTAQNEDELQSLFNNLFVYRVMH